MTFDPEEEAVEGRVIIIIKIKKKKPFQTFPDVVVAAADCSHINYSSIDLMRCTKAAELTPLASWHDAV